MDKFPDPQFGRESFAALTKRPIPYDYGLERHLK
jgi:hypothetical protein